MPSNRELLMGLLSQGQQEGAASAKQAQAMQQEQALKEYLMGKQQQADLGAEKARQDQVMQLVAQNPKLNYSAGKDSFAVSHREPNPMAMQAANDRFEKQVQGIGDRYEKGKFPESLSAIGSIEATAKPDAQGNPTYQSVGPIANALPSKMMPAAEGLHSLASKFLPEGIASHIGMPAGSANQRAAIDTLVNQLMHAQFGARQTEQEAQRIANQLSTYAGGDDKLFATNLGRAKELVQAAEKNVAQSSPPAALREYIRRGSSMDMNSLPSSQMAGAMPRQRPMPQQAMRPPGMLSPAAANAAPAPAMKPMPAPPSGMGGQTSPQQNISPEQEYQMLLNKYGEQPR